MHKDTMQTSGALLRRRAADSHSLEEVRFLTCPAALISKKCGYADPVNFMLEYLFTNHNQLI